MGLIKDILFKNYSMKDFDTDVRSWMGIRQPTNSGSIVNQQTALRLSTLLACIRVRTESFGCLPCSIYKRRKGGKGRDEATDHPLWEILHNTPNEDMTALTWREAMNINFDCDGNCYSIIQTNKRGQVISLYPIPYYMMDVRQNQTTGAIEYGVIDRGKYEPMPKSRVYHVPGFGFDGLRGYSVINLSRETIGLGLSVNEFTQRFYGQGMNFGIALETDKTFKDQTEVDSVRKQFEERYGGLANAHRPIVLQGGMKINRIPISFTDAQTIEIMKLTDTQICGLMRVPPHMVAHLENATFSNIEHQGIEYVIYSMLPVLTRHEQTMNWRLFTPKERAEGYYVKFNVDSLLRGDTKTRAEALAIKRQNGVISSNEWRALDELNPVDDSAGDALLVNGNMISIDTASKQLPKQTGGGEK